MKMFPVLDQQFDTPADQRLVLPKAVPWAMVEPWRDRAKHLHAQTLERLADRGGLSPREMFDCAVVSVVPHRRVSEAEALEWLNAQLEAAKAAEREAHPMVVINADAWATNDSVAAAWRDK